MSMYGKNHYNTVISLQLIKINEKKKKKEDNWRGAGGCGPGREVGKRGGEVRTSPGVILIVT